MPKQPKDLDQKFVDLMGAVKVEKPKTKPKGK